MEVVNDVPRGPGEVGWQAHKSSNTRQRILDAAVECILETGYANTTTSKIAKRAGLSRGATLHHFPSKLDVIKATVEYLHQKRLRAFRKSAAQLPTGKDRVKRAVAVYWEHATHPLYAAFLELSVAARHDKALRAILVPAQRLFDEEWHRTAQEVFPEWQSDPAAFDLALDLSRKLMEGMALSRLTQSRKDDNQVLLAFLESELRALAPK